MNKDQEAGQKLEGRTECRPKNDEFVIQRRRVFVSNGHTNEMPTRQSVHYLELSSKLRRHEQKMGIDV